MYLSMYAEIMYSSTQWLSLEKLILAQRCEMLQNVYQIHLCTVYLTPM